jgi:hypothetical protein
LIPIQQIDAMKKLRENNHWTHMLTDKLMSWSHLGVTTLNDGAQLIGHVPHVAPFAYLHIIPAPLKEKEISASADALGISLPDDFHDYLLYANGLHAFSGTIAVYGFRKNYQRADVVAASAQPFDLSIPNHFERPKSIRDTQIVVGGYKVDGSQVVMDGSGRTHRILEQDANQISNTWSSFSEWLTSEVLRLSSIFDAKGICTNPYARLPQ